MERLKRLYLGLPPALRGAVPGRLEAWARDRLLPALDRTRGARGLEDKLWGGFSRPARAGLAALMADPAAPPREAAAAALALARWYGATGDFEAALACVVAARHRRPGLARDRRQQLLEALFLTRLGRIAEARALLSGAGSSVAFLRANTCNPAVAGTSGDAAAALAEINAVFRRFGLTEIARADPAAWLALGNLRGIAEPGSIDGPLVSVIVPVHDAAPTLGWALDSLAAQTWARLEVLVVDDASRDGSAAVAAAFAARDPRFRLLRQPTNLGGYAARNRALGEAAGAFVTVQDADDWAHPEKIARHVADLDRRRLPLNLSAWVRATDALLFWGPWQPSPNLPAPNLSSVFFRRELVAAAGPWDTARVGADREFVARVERLHGLALQRPFLPDCPLAFGRDGSGSLTRGGVADAASALHGVRREYHEAFALWHADLDPAALPAAAPPFFPAPAAIRAAAGDEPERDLLLIGDFNLRGGTHQSAMHMLRAAGDAGLTAAILHYRRPDLDVTRPLAAAVRRFAQANAVRIVAPGEAVAARTVVVTYPPVFAEALDRFPAVAHVTLAVVVNQMAERDLDRRDVVYDPAAVRATLRELLGGEGHWIPISARVRALMAADPRYPRPHPDTWTPLIGPEASARTPVWRGPGSNGGRPRPVIGRHGRDHPLKWPVDPHALAAAYCADRDCEVRFLGGAGHARARLGRWPRNWRDAAFGSRDVPEFLAGLDLFLHFPDAAYVEEFGRAPMEAMAAGVPVILPPEFAPTFGDAALYAAPGEVWPLAQALWRDRAAWEARVAAGRAFVAAECGYHAFPPRLARLAAPAKSGGRVRAAGG